MDSNDGFLKNHFIEEISSFYKTTETNMKNPLYPI